MANVEQFPVWVVKTDPVSIESIRHHLNGIDHAAKHMKFIIRDRTAIGRFQIRFEKNSGLNLGVRLFQHMVSIIDLQKPGKFCSDCL